MLPASPGDPWQGPNWLMHHWDAFSPELDAGRYNNRVRENLVKNLEANFSFLECL
jgi:hypothetical protein